MLGRGLYPVDDGVLRHRRQARIHGCRNGWQLLDQLGDSRTGAPAECRGRRIEYRGSRCYADDAGVGQRCVQLVSDQIDALAVRGVARPPDRVAGGVGDEDRCGEPGRGEGGVRPHDPPVGQMPDVSG